MHGQIAALRSPKAFSPIFTRNSGLAYRFKIDPAGKQPDRRSIAVAQAHGIAFQDNAPAVCGLRISKNSIFSSQWSAPSLARWRRAPR
ncbi:hypothetical protein AM571_CH03891 [Rhizobium etli 8C-3]|uniref:Uncharacterized protein n=1 Tax=Rhizobium etli 8C-3 TaxID=538025 RepID=A0A1L5P9C3_RHIET|nr:hypothetical protein AM571_CH03891 [Rhizobium etli 8C-3]